MSKSTKILTVSALTKRAKIRSPSKVVGKIATSGTKSSLILNLLNQPSGATVRELTEVTNWQDHSVRGLISGTFKKKLALNITSEIVNGERRYKIVNTGIHK